MKTVALIILLYPYIQLGAQIDSTIYWDSKNTEGVIYMGYVQYLYPNNSIKSEGWIQKKESERNLSQKWSNQYGKFPVISKKVGTWKEYYPNGNLKVKMNIPLDTAQARTERHYDTKGRLIFEFIFPDSEEYDVRLSGEFKTAKLKNFTKRWFKNDQIYQEAHYKNGLKDGSWHWYNTESGLLYKTIEYKDGKKIDMRFYGKPSVD